MPLRTLQPSPVSPATSPSASASCRRVVPHLAAALALLCALAIAPSAFAQDAAEPTRAPSLDVGDDAPAVDAETWLQGDAFSTFERGQVYVVEFWATWCGPCRESIPHLNALQDRYGDDVRVVGVTSEGEDVVTQWLQGRDNAPAYTLACDPDGSVDDAYMKASGKTGIPTAFIVDHRGQLAWIGHPMQMDAVLDAVVDRRWDAKAYAEWNDAHQARSADLDVALAEQDFDRAIRILDQLVNDHLEDEELYGNPNRHLHQRYQLVAIHSDDEDAIRSAGRDLVDRFWERPSALNNLAWWIATDPALDGRYRDLELAMTASVRSNIADPDNAASLDTLARIYFETGDLESALRYQRLAVDAQNPVQDEIRQALERYESEARERGLVVPDRREKSDEPAPADPDRPRTDA